jgi:Heat shock protein
VVTELSGRPTLSSAVPTIAFSADQVSGFGSCNRFTAGYRQTGSTVSFSQLAMTAMACLDAAVMEQESSFAAALSKVTSVRSGDGRLELIDSSGAVLAKLQPPPAAPDRSLHGTQWVLDTIVIGQTATSVVADSTVTLTITEGQLSGKACNNYRASVEVDGSSLTIGPVMSTKMACPEPGRTEQERRLFELLPRVTSFTVRGDRLTLTASDGALDFHAE